MKKIKTKEKVLEGPLYEVVVETDLEGNESPVIKTHFGFDSPHRDSSGKSNFEATGSLSGSRKASHVDTSINLGDSCILSISENTSVIPTKFSFAKSNSEEVQTSGITMDISNMDTSLNTGDGLSTHEADDISSASISSVHVSIIVSPTFETNVMDISTSFPRFISPSPTSLPASNISSTFSNIMDQPITSLFPSQSSDGPKFSSKVEQ